MFRSALAQRRCIVPADAFYEWRATPSGKQPYAIARRDSQPLAFAALWEILDLHVPGAGFLRTFCIMTTTANATMAKLHNRMPVILETSDWPVWLGEEPGDHLALLRPAAADVLYMWPVSRAVNNVRNDGPELLDRVDDPHAPPPSDAPPEDNPA